MKSQRKSHKKVQKANPPYSSDIWESSANNSSDNKASFFHHTVLLYIHDFSQKTASTFTMSLDYGDTTRFGVWRNMRPPCRTADNRYWFKYVMFWWMWMKSWGRHKDVNNSIVYALTILSHLSKLTREDKNWCLSNAKILKTKVWAVGEEQQTPTDWVVCVCCWW